MVDDKDIAQQELQKLNIHPGDIYQHYKGGKYEIVTTALDEPTLEHLIVYRNMSEGTIWVRTVQNWQENVETDGKTVPRFSLIEN